MATLPELEMMVRYRDELLALIFEYALGDATADTYRTRLAEFDEFIKASKPIKISVELNPNSVGGVG